MAKFYYAVRIGKNPGVYETWAECEKQVKGFKSASFKKFPTYEEAASFVKGEGGQTSVKESGVKSRKVTGNSRSNDLSKTSVGDTYPIAYVDGSYNISTKEFGLGGIIMLSKIKDEDIKNLFEKLKKKASLFEMEGCLCLDENLSDNSEYSSAFPEKIHDIYEVKKENYILFSATGSDEELATMRNVAGEIKASEYVIRKMPGLGYKEITIVHDYEGIAKWCTGEWKTNKEGTKAYKRIYDEFEEQVDISFEKVKGHSNDVFNDIADVLAKLGCGQ